MVDAFLTGQAGDPSSGATGQTGTQPLGIAGSIPAGATLSLTTTRGGGVQCPTRDVEPSWLGTSGHGEEASISGWPGLQVNGAIYRTCPPRVLYNPWRCVMLAKCPHCETGCDKCHNGRTTVGFGIGSVFTRACQNRLCGFRNGGRISKKALDGKPCGNCIMCGADALWELEGEITGDPAESDS